jgi:hypothetical protein
MPSGIRTIGDRTSGGPHVFFGHLTNHELQISLRVEAELEAFTEIKNWAVLLLNIFYQINFNLDVKNNFEDVYFINP